MFKNEINKISSIKQCKLLRFNLFMEASPDRIRYRVDELSNLSAGFNTVTRCMAFTVQRHVFVTTLSTIEIIRVCSTAMTLAHAENRPTDIIIITTLFQKPYLWSHFKNLK